MPLEAYHFFINKFVDAIRVEIARSSEKAYSSLSLRDTLHMFMISSEQELHSFIQSNSGREGIEWAVEGDRLWFRRQRAE